MRIQGNVQPVSGIYTKDKKVSHVENINKSVEVKDNVKISTKGKDFAVAQKALKEIPDVRKEKVEELSKKIENNNYSVKGEDIINKLFDTGINLEG